MTVFSMRWRQETQEAYSRTFSNWSWKLPIIIIHTHPANQQNHTITHQQQTNHRPIPKFMQNLPISMKRMERVLAALQLKMDNNGKYQTLLISNKTTPKQLQQFCLDFDRTKVASLLDVLVAIERILTNRADPHVQLNALLMLMGFVRRADYPSISFTEALLLGVLTLPAKTAASGDNKLIYDYFESAGFSAGTSNLQALSYHFTRNALTLFLLLAYLRPKRLYKSRQLTVPSRAKQIEMQLREKGLSEQEYNEISATSGFLGVRKELLRVLVGLQRHCDGYVQPMIKTIERFLISGNRTRAVDCVVGLLRSHEAYLCTEMVPRLAEIFCYHNEFRVRREALLLICEVVYSGDLQSLVILNFTQYFRIVALKVADAALHAKFNKLLIFPQVAGQVEEKRLFLNDFLLTVQRLARLFPSLQAYFINSGQTPLLQIYRKLTECGARFPKWQDASNFLRKVADNFRANRQYNMQFLQQLERQRVEWLVMDPMHPTYRNLLYFLDRNTHTLASLRESGKLNPNDDNWLELLDFRRHFEEMLERVTDDVPAEELDALIYRGLALKSSIAAMETLHNRYQRGEIALQQFQQALATPPIEEGPSIRKRMQQLGAGLRGRQKDPILISLSQSESIIKSKVNLRIQQLASRKAESCEVISQLEIYSRSFIAHKLHSQQLMDQFLPMLYFHPLRKVKRRNNGIRICSEERSPSPPHLKGECTPRFRSVLVLEGKASVGGSKKGGLRVMQREGAKYQKYLQVLGRREWVKYLTGDALVVLDNGWARVQRSQIRSNNLPENQILELTFTCSCEGGEVTYTISEQPSIQVRCRRRDISSGKFQLEIKGLWVKFGFALPTVTFSVRGQTVAIPLPFSFNNYLSIAPALKPPKRPPLPSQRHPLDRKEFPYIQSVKKFLRGMKIQGGRLSGWVKFFSWECNLRISLDAQSFLLEVQPTQEKQDDILINFLPLFLIRLLSSPTNSLHS